MGGCRERLHLGREVGDGGGQLRAGMGGPVFQIGVGIVGGGSRRCPGELRAFRGQEGLVGGAIGKGISRLDAGLRRAIAELGIRGVGRGGGRDSGQLGAFAGGVGLGGRAIDQ